MTFILSAQREGSGPENMREGFRRYADYLTANRDRFPPSAYALATSDWFYDANDHRCPHDAWLESLSIAEPSSGARNEQRIVSIRIRLLGAYRDGHLELFYPRVHRYGLDLTNGDFGHRDWCYDEFRLSDGGRLIHEIEWYHMSELARWVIEADDMLFSWHPFERRESRSPGLTVKRS